VKGPFSSLMDAGAYRISCLGRSRDRAAVLIGCSVVRERRSSLAMRGGKEEMEDREDSGRIG